jgi:glycosyltransferase involved in cell wall biosynthesis
MKILSIITTFTAGGAEVLASNLSSAFASSGHQSHVLALCPARLVGNSEQTEAELRTKVAQGGGTTGVLTNRDRRNLIAGVAAMRAVLRTEQPHVVHAHTVRALLLLKIAGASGPIVATHHNSRLSFPPLVFRLLGRKVSAYVGISDECCRLLATKSQTEVVRIVNATGPGFLAAEPRIRLRQPAELLAVGALTSQKNYHMMIEAAVLARARCPKRPFTLRIAGGGAALQALQAQIDSLGAHSFVKLLGDCNDIADRMRSADIFVNTSHYEGMPIAMLEALQSGLPVVATDVAGTRELVRHEDNGILVPPGDCRLFASALCSILEAPQSYPRMSSAALAEGRKYQLDHCAQAHLQLYERLIANHERAGTA